MISLEWYRNFVAVYRAASVSGAARARHVTQSAVSQQLAMLEEAVGIPLFDRTSRGMSPTARGAALYSEVFDALDRLDRVSRSVRATGIPNSPIRLGSSPEYFQGFALARLAPLNLPLAISFGDDRSLLAQVESGALDVAATVTKPTARTLEHRHLGEQRYVLIGSANAAVPPRNISLSELARWLNDRPWISYSDERPITRRFWQQTLGARFEAQAALVVPDMRAVVTAVEKGMGFSLVPEFVSLQALSEDRVQEIWPIASLVPSERWLLTYRQVDSDREALIRVSNALAAI